MKHFPRPSFFLHPANAAFTPSSESKRTIISPVLVVGIIYLKIRLKGETARHKMVIGARSTVTGSRARQTLLRIPSSSVLHNLLSIRYLSSDYMVSYSISATRLKIWCQRPRTRAVRKRATPTVVQKHEPAPSISFRCLPRLAE